MQLWDDEKEAQEAKATSGINYFVMAFRARVDAFKVSVGAGRDKWRNLARRSLFSY